MTISKETDMSWLCVQDVRQEGGRDIATPLKIEIEADGTINYAMQQNDVPIIKLLRITNQADVTLNDLTITISTEPCFAEEMVLKLSSLSPQGSHNFGPIDLHPSHNYLAHLTEKVTGSLDISVKKGDELLLSHKARIDVLAYDEWSGLNSPPEILAAFVTPNSMAVESILREAADILCEWLGCSSIDGYQSKSPQRAFQITGAIFSAIQKHRIAYVSPPASYEATGQKIRTPDRVLGNGLGTCLDLTVLIAACLEQAGLNPLLVVHEGHAYAGVWLEEDCFADAILYDPLQLRKRIDLREICVFETTLLTSDQPVSFQQAVDAGRRKLGEEGAFRFAVDVRRAR